MTTRVGLIGCTEGLALQGKVSSQACADDKHVVINEQADLLQINPQ
jgi:hypothetical protein